MRGAHAQRVWGRSSIWGKYVPNRNLCVLLLISCFVFLKPKYCVIETSV